MTEPLPDSLQPTAADIARDKELAAKAKSILDEVAADSGHRVRVNQDSYSSITYGADGEVISRVQNGKALLSREQEAVARAQSAANAEIKQMEANLQRLVDQYNEIKGYDNEGKPVYVRSEADRARIQKQIRQAQLGIVNQKRLNEIRWRREAAPALRQAQRDTIRYEELSAELEARGRVTRVNRF